MADDWSRAKRGPQAGATLIRAALGDANATTTAYITRHPACSSCLRPNVELLRAYPVRSWFDVVREERITMVRYEDLARERKLPQPQVGKIDVQGLEGQVLEGMGAVLDGLLCLEFECQLMPIYVGQQTFGTLYAMLTDRGFILRNLQPQGPFEGEVVELNTFWSRRPRSQVEALVIELWETANSLRPGPDFHAVDAAQRAAHRFND